MFRPATRSRPAAPIPPMRDPSRAAPSPSPLSPPYAWTAEDEERELVETMTALPLHEPREQPRCKSPTVHLLVDVPMHLSTHAHSQSREGALAATPLARLLRELDVGDVKAVRLLDGGDLLAGGDVVGAIVTIADASPGALERVRGAGLSAASVTEEQMCAASQTGKRPPVETTAARTDGGADPRAHWRILDTPRRSNTARTSASPRPGQPGTALSPVTWDEAAGGDASNYSRRRTLEFESRGGIGREAAVPSSPFDPLTWSEREGATNPPPVNTGTLFGRTDHASDRGSIGGGLFGATSR